MNPGIKRELPKSFVNTYKGVDAGTIYGIPMVELTKDELIMVIAYIHEDTRRKEKDIARQDSFLEEIITARSKY